MDFLKQAAAQHKVLALQAIDSLGTNVIVRQGAHKSSAAGSVPSKVLGTRTQIIGYGEEVTLKAIVLTPSSSISMDKTQSEAMPLGLYSNSDLVLMVKLEECLLESGRIHGQTIFDTAKEIEVQGSKYTKSGSERTGLPPYGPYVLWVGLRVLGS